MWTQRSLRGRWLSALSVALPLAAVAGVSVCALAGLRQGQQECQSHLKQVALGVQMYVQDYDERYPPMKSPAQVQNRILPYIKDRSLYSCPVTGTEYLPNPALNYLPVRAVKAPDSTIMFRDAKPHTTDTGKPSWNVAYADGHVKLSMTEPQLGKPAPTPQPGAGHKPGRRTSGKGRHRHGR